MDHEAEKDLIIGAAIRQAALIDGIHCLLVTRLGVGDGQDLQITTVMHGERPAALMRANAIIAEAGRAFAAVEAKRKATEERNTQ